jgi:hypothetical protein
MALDTATDSMAGPSSKRLPVISATHHEHNPEGAWAIPPKKDIEDGIIQELNWGTEGEVRLIAEDRREPDVRAVNRGSD